MIPHHKACLTAITAAAWMLGGIVTASAEVNIQGQVEAGAGAVSGSTVTL
jgi:hypothetical protein